MIDGATLNVLDFGATRTDPDTGIGSYCDDAFAAAFTKAVATRKTVFVPSGWYKFQNDLIVKTNFKGEDRLNTVLLFDSGKGMNNFISADTYYFVQNMDNLSVESNKEHLWNANDAGDAYVSGIVRFDVRLKYGQRVGKGNKTTTPNNILSNVAIAQQDGTGFWNKDYGQWLQTAGAAPDLSGLPPTTRGTDENMFKLTSRSSIERCNFKGFEKGLVLLATYESSVTNCVFESCNRGIKTVSGAYAGGSASARITSLNISDNDFIDTDIAHEANDFGQSTFNNNVVQPAIVAINYKYGAGSSIHDNYVEIVHTMLYNTPNDNTAGTMVYNNFVNSAYSRYHVYMTSGINWRFSNAGAGNNKIYFNAQVSKSWIDEGYTLDVSALYFLRNGNKFKPQETKEYFIKTTGVGGSSFTIDYLQSSGDNDLPFYPEFKQSQTGIELWKDTSVDNRYVCLNLDMLDRADLVTWYQPTEGSLKSNPVRYFAYPDGSGGATTIDLSEDGIVHFIRMQFV